MYDDSGRNKRAKQNLLKQAFQETDGRITKQEITGKDGQPLQTTSVQATQEQVNEAVRKAQEEY